MSRRSRRKHRQEWSRKHPAQVEQPTAPAPAARETRKGRGLWIGVLVVALAAASYALVGVGKHRSKANTGGAPAVSTAAPAVLLSTGGVAGAVAGWGPRIQFETPVYDFGTVKSGEAVKHTYYFTNVGGATLQVSNVQASCGCTTAGEWTRQLEPGKVGAIPVQFNSGGFGGQIGKTVTVTCNDTNQPSVVLQIKGNVWKPVDVIPQFVALTATSETPATSTVVRIVNNEPTPLVLAQPESSSPAFATELKTNTPGKEFEVVVRTVPPLPARNATARLSLKTSSTNVPEIKISAYLNVQPVITLTPRPIALPVAPLAVPLPVNLVIRNNGTNVLKVSEATVNAKGVEVEVQETEPGRAFALALNFPAGFEVAQGEKVEVSVKTSHPEFPVMKVPVLQTPRLAPPQAVSGTPAAAPATEKKL